MEIPYVESHTIFETIIGSRAYGTNYEESDYDKAGVMIPGEEYFFGFDKFEQFQEYPDEDKVIYDIRKALRLITDNNPNMMDLLYVPERCVVKSTSYWDKIRDSKDLFLSKRCRYTFSGYAIAQLNRIKTHRKFLLNPPKEPPTRESLGLPEHSIFPTSQLKAVCYAAIEFVIEEEKENFITELDGIYGDYVTPLLARFVKDDERSLALEWLQLGIKSQAKAFNSLGTKYIKDEYIEQAKNEVKFYNASKEWTRYLSWKKFRNKKRTVLEEKFGYDCKHAMHLVRLLRMGEEILRTGQVNVDRTNIDAEELKEIREGSWDFDKIEEYTKEKDKEFDILYKETSLKRSSNYSKINRLCVDVVKEFFN